MMFASHNQATAMDTVMVMAMAMAMAMDTVMAMAILGKKKNPNPSLKDYLSDKEGHFQELLLTFHSTY